VDQLDFCDGGRRRNRGRQFFEGSEDLTGGASELSGVEEIAAVHGEW
jgi:hypothetical protein